MLTSGPENVNLEKAKDRITDEPCDRKRDTNYAPIYLLNRHRALCKQAINRQHRTENGFGAIVIPL